MRKIPHTEQMENNNLIRKLRLLLGLAHNSSWPDVYKSLASYDPNPVYPDTWESMIARVKLIYRLHKKELELGIETTRSKVFVSPAR